MNLANKYLNHSQNFILLSRERKVKILTFKKGCAFNERPVYNYSHDKLFKHTITAIHCTVKDKYDRFVH